MDASNETLQSDAPTSTFNYTPLPPPQKLITTQVKRPHSFYHAIEGTRHRRLVPPLDQ